MWRANTANLPAECGEGKLIIYVEFSKEGQQRGGLEQATCLERIAGEPCLIVNYRDMSMARLRELRPSAVMVGGFGSSFDAFDVRELLGLDEVFKGADSPPILAVCGGHQLLAFCFSRDLRRIKRLHDEPMRRLRPGEPDLYPEYHPGYFKERGVFPVRIVRPQDPLFEGLPRTIMVTQSHYCEVKTIPRGFALLATNANCRIQAMRHRSRPLYGMQFHPEKHQSEYPHGGRLLQNFFRLARAI